MKMKAALFDLDGTLMDSMWVWDRLMIDFLAKHQLPTVPEIMEKVSHMSLVQSSVYVQQEYAMTMTPGEIYNEWMDMVSHAYAEEVSLKPGAKEYLLQLKAQGTRIGLVTACDRALCTACLQNNGIYELFDTITYVDEVGKGKDAPDIYIESLRRLDCAAEDAVLFEDILTGLRTAKKIGLRVIAVEENDQDEIEALKQEADLYIKNFYELIK